MAMNIMLDFISFQLAGGIGGAGSFTKRICDELFEHKKCNKYYALIDSSIELSERYDILAYAKDNNATVIDLKKRKLGDIINEEHIDILFISIGQWYSKYNLTDINCKTIMFIHDIFDIEREDMRLDLSLYDKNGEGFVDYLRRIVNVACGRWHRQMMACYDNIMPLYMSEKTIPYTVSEYTSRALSYYFPDIKNKIRICYSPLKNVERKETIENEHLRKIIEMGKPYLLHLGAHRRYKNPQNTVKVFKRLAEKYQDLHLITLRYGNEVNDRHIDIKFLSDSDLEHAYANATALIFTSYFEGFGYPPVEAMKYGTPTVASNVTSIPEVVGNAALLVSPFYPADIYAAISRIIESPEMLKEKCLKRYDEICCRQQKDMELLMMEFDDKAIVNR